MCKYETCFKLVQVVLGTTEMGGKRSADMRVCIQGQLDLLGYESTVLPAKWLDQRTYSKYSIIHHPVYGPVLEFSISYITIVFTPSSAPPIYHYLSHPKYQKANMHEKSLKRK